jgi:DNA-binding transcriptional regulator YiaG
MKAKSSTSRGTRKNYPRAAESINRAMREIESMIRDGAMPHERFTVRTIEIPDEPGAYGPAEIRHVREVLNISQPIFAGLLGASTFLVQGWEQGKRKPNRMARRLLDEVRNDPARWRAKLRLEMSSKR